MGKRHTKVLGSCASQGYDKYIANDPIFKDAKLYRKSLDLAASVPHLRGNAQNTTSLVPGKSDLNPLCYECANEAYADHVAEVDFLVKRHTKVLGSCASQGFDKYVANDPVF